MNDETQSPGQNEDQAQAVNQEATETIGQPEAAEIEMSPQEVQAGKTFAILGYALSFVGLPFFIIPLITRDNEFSLYHAKQVLVIWLAGIALSVISAPLAVVCVGIILGIVGGVALLVFTIMGLVNAVKGLAKPIPLIGAWGEQWFKGLTKSAKA